jgi:hypothetical protein
MPECLGSEVSLGRAESIFASMNYQLDDTELVVYLNADEINTLKAQGVIQLASETTADGTAVWRWVGPRSRK